MEELNGNNGIQDSLNRRLPAYLRIAAGYLIVAGILDLLLMLRGPRLNPGFEAQNLAFKAGAYFRAISNPTLIIVSGIGLLFRKSWARKLALLMIVIQTFFGIQAFAMAYSHGKPSLSVLIFSFIMVGSFNGILFFLIFKKTSREAMIARKPTNTA